LLTETAGIKQNQTENAKPSQFSWVVLEAPGDLRKDKGIQQVSSYLVSMLIFFNNLAQW
jgi:hypothetical protein